MTEPWTDTQATLIYEAIFRCLRSQQTRQLAGRCGIHFIADEQASDFANELFVRLANDALPRRLLAATNDDHEVQRLVYYFGALHLQNIFIRDILRWKVRNRAWTEDAQLNTTIRRNGHAYQPKKSLQTSNEAPHNLWPLVAALPRRLAEVIELWAEGRTLVAIAHELSISVKTASRRRHEACSLLQRMVELN